MMARIQTESPVDAICGNKTKFRRTKSPGFCRPDTCRNLGFATVKKECDRRKENWISEFKIMTGSRKSVEIKSTDDYKYFRRPIVPFSVSKRQNIEIPVRFEHEILNDVVQNAQNQCYIFPPKSEPHKTIGTQTDYRDSESQTVPWEPRYKIRPGHDPEELRVAHLQLSNGRLPGVHEIEIINRMRMRREWEAILPPMDTAANRKMRSSIITALEVDEWAFRESEIQAIMDYRLELMAEMNETRDCERQKKVENRFNRLNDRLDKRRDREVGNIKCNLRRELRKLHKKHRGGGNQRFSKRDIIFEHANPSSELYAPQMRFGVNPQRRHETIRSELLKDSHIESTNETDVMPNSLPTYEELKLIKPKPKPASLCIRETRWTEEKLKQLHTDLRAIRINVNPLETSTLMKRKYKPPPLPLTPYRINTENSGDIEIHKLSTLIQKIVRGRAVQCMMFDGRDRCRELIEELQSTHALEERGKKIRQKEKMQMIDLQRSQNDRSIEEDRLCEILNSLEGMTVSGMLDFLSKELIRLEDERRAHAFALLAERERSMREAVEAGRRQFERNRRREFDEAFRQIAKINQDSVETYLEDIIKEGIEWVSDQAAKEYIFDLADKVDDMAKYEHEKATELAQEEMIANMIYNFVLPEVEKRSVRKSIRENQQSYLQNAHSTIYNEILNLSSAIENLKTSDDEGEGKLPTGESSTESQSDQMVEQVVMTSQTSETTELGSSDLDDPLTDVHSIFQDILLDVVPTENTADIVRELLEPIVVKVTGQEGHSSGSSTNGN